jgi:hypothetical protein
MIAGTDSRHRYGDKVLKILNSKKQLQCFDRSYFSPRIDALERLIKVHADPFLSALRA